MHLLLGLADEHLGRDRLPDLVVVAADVVAVPLQDLGLVLPLVRLAAEVRRVGVARDDPQGELLAAAADEDLRVRLLHRLRVALRAVEREVLALVGDVGLGPHRLHDLDRLAQHAGCGRRPSGTRSRSR